METKKRYGLKLLPEIEFRGVSSVALAVPAGGGRGLLQVRRRVTHEGRLEKFPDPVSGSTVMCGGVEDEFEILTVSPDDLSDLQSEILALAWHRGAPDCTRHDRAPLPADTNPWEPGIGLTAALCGRAYEDVDVRSFEDIRTLPIDPTEEERESVESAARHGWVSWLFKPVHGLKDFVNTNFWRKYLHETPRVDGDGFRAEPPPRIEDARLEQIAASRLVSENHQMIFEF